MANEIAKLIDQSLLIDTSGGTPAELVNNRNCTISESAGIIDTSSAGDAWDTNEAGRKRYTMAGEVHYTLSNAKHILIQPGAKLDWSSAVTDIATVADVETWSGTIVVNSVDTTIVSRDDTETVVLTFSATGTGALTKTNP